MRLVLISDTHGMHQQLKNIPDGDVLIHSGDFTGYGDSYEVVAFNNWIGTLPHKHKIVIAGNHDTCMEDNKNHKHFTNAHYLQDSFIEIDGFKFYGSPYTPTFLHWSFMEDDSELYKRWSLIPHDVDVLITHGPPKGVLDSLNDQFGGTRNVGSNSLREWVLLNKPKCHIFGHIHSGHGQQKLNETNCINGAILNEQYEIEYKPIVFDLER